jgi:hypothetical protein
MRAIMTARLLISIDARAQIDRDADLADDGDDDMI